MSPYNECRTLFEGLGIDLDSMLDLHGVIVVREHVFQLHHAGGAAGGHHMGARGHHVVTLALADDTRQVVVEEVEGTAATAAAVGFFPACSWGWS